MKKGICILILLLLLGTLVSCAVSGIEKAPLGSDPAPVSQEDLAAEIANLQQQVDSMRTKMLAAQGALTQAENYHCTNWWDYELLELAAQSNQPVGQFYGLIRAVDRADDGQGFVFTIDPLELDPEREGPDSDRFINPDTSTEQFNASRKVIVNGQGYASYADKEKDLLNRADDDRLFNLYHVFFTVGHEIVYLMEYGP